MHFDKRMAGTYGVDPVIQRIVTARIGLPVFRRKGRTAVLLDAVEISGVGTDPLYVYLQKLNIL
jgi:hypothetical protein